MPSIGYRLPKELAGTVLGEIVASKLRVLAEDRKKLPVEALRMASDRWPVVRPLKRAIQVQVENPLAQEILQGKFRPGDVIEVGVAADHLEFRNAA